MKKRMILTFFLAILSLTFSSAASAIVNEFQPLRDTFIASGLPDTNFYYGDLNNPKDERHFLFIGNDNASNYGIQRSLIYFNLGSLSRQAYVTNARLKIYQVGGYARDPGNKAISVYNVTSNLWLQQQVGWNTFGAGGIYDPVPYAKTAVDLNDGYHVWDVTTLIRQWVDYGPNQGLPNYGFLLKADDESAFGDRKFYSEVFTSMNPRLELEYQLDTKAPKNPIVESLKHKVKKWNKDNTIDISWKGAIDDISGLDGYSFRWSRSSRDFPDTKKDAEETQTKATSLYLDNAGNWYFHLSTRDNVGNWSEPVHLGPFYVGKKLKPKIVFGVARQSNKNNGFITLIGELRDNEGLVSAKKRVRIQKRIIKKNKPFWQTVKMVKTDKNGLFKIKVAPKKTTFYRASFSGNSMFTTGNSKIIQITANSKA